MSRYAVTGCAGFIGSHLSETLLARGHDVVGIDAFTDYYGTEVKRRNLSRALEHANFELLELDLAEAPLRSVMETVDGVYHLAGQPGVRRSWRSSFPLYLRHNVQATQRLFAAAADVGRRVVMASSSSVYGRARGYATREGDATDPISPYGVTKLMCEKLAYAFATEARLDAVSLRYFTVYGPRQRPDMAFSRIFDAIREGGVFKLFGSGSQSRDFTYVLDAVNATISAFEHAPAGAVYNVGGGCEVSLREVIELAEGLAGGKLRTQFEGHAAGDMQRTCADTSRIRSETGWAPQTSLPVGLEAQFAACATSPATVIEVAASQPAGATRMGAVR